MLDDDATERHPDWDEVASRWLDGFDPFGTRARRISERNRCYYETFEKIDGPGPRLGQRILEVFDEFPILPAPDERISACIVGIP